MHLSNIDRPSRAVSASPGGSPQHATIADSTDYGHLTSEAPQYRVAQIDADRHDVAAEPGDLDILGQRIEADVVAARIDPRRDLAHCGAEPDAVEPWADIARCRFGDIARGCLPYSSSSGLRAVRRLNSDRTIG